MIEDPAPRRRAATTAFHALFRAVVYLAISSAALALDFVPGSAQLQLDRPDLLPPLSSPVVARDRGTLVHVARTVITDGQLSLSLIERDSLGRLLRPLPLDANGRAEFSDVLDVATDGRRVAVVWDAAREGFQPELGVDNEGAAVYLRLFDAGLSPLSDVIQVSGNTPGGRFWPSVAVNEDQVLVTFTAERVGESLTSFARRFDWNGVPAARAFEVIGVDALGEPGRVRAELLAFGDAVFTWTSTLPGSPSRAYLRAFNRSDRPLMRDLDLNTGVQPADNDAAFDLVRLQDDRYVVTWSRGAAALRARIFDREHEPASAVAEVAGADASMAGAAEIRFTGISANPDGGFLVSWQSRCVPPTGADPTCSDDSLVHDGDGWGSYLRTYGTVAQPLGPVHRMAADTAGDQVGSVAAVTQGLSNLGAHWRPLVFSDGDAGKVLLRGAAPPCGADVVDALRACSGADQRFAVAARWRDFDGAPIAARVREQQLAWASFGFAEDQPTDLVLKILDARALTRSHWIFLASLTDLAFEMSVVDTETGLVRFYANPVGRFASLGDVPGLPQVTSADALTTSELASRITASVAGGVHRDERTPASPAQMLSAREQCGETDTLLCIEGRFAAQVTWTDFQGGIGPGRRLAMLSAGESFWFFDPENPELTVKMLDGRSINGHWWVYLGALTNVGFSLEITDLVTGERRTWTNQVGNFASFGDVEAFPDP